MENALTEIKRVDVVGLELFFRSPLHIKYFRNAAIKGVLEEHCRRILKRRDRRWKFWTHEDYTKLLGEEQYRLCTSK